MNWDPVGPMGLWAYALSAGSAKGQCDRQGCRGDSQAKRGCGARMLVERTTRQSLPCEHQAKDYVWGSNGIAAEYGMYLLIANLIRSRMRLLWIPRGTICTICWAGTHFRSHG